MSGVGERYFITGCQLGMLKIFVRRDAIDIREDIEKILKDIEDKQFIGNAKKKEKVTK